MKLRNAFCKAHSIISILPGWGLPMSVRGDATKRSNNFLEATLQVSGQGRERTQASPCQPLVKILIKFYLTYGSLLPLTWLGMPMQHSKAVAAPATPSFPCDVLPIRSIFKSTLERETGKKGSYIPSSFQSCFQSNWTGKLLTGELRYE